MGLAAVTGAQGRTEQAVQLFSAARAQFATLGAGIWPADKADFERRLAPIRDQLDEAGFVAASNAGQAMTLDEAVARATRGD